LALLAHFLAMDGLERDGGERAQQLDVMGAAVHAAELLPQEPRPAAADLCALQCRECRRDRRADCERSGGGFRNDVQDPERPVDGDADPHVVQRLVGLNLAAKVVRKSIGLAVGHPAFDVVMAVWPQIALEGEVALVQQLASNGILAHAAAPVVPPPGFFGCTFTLIRVSG
jgi:hypothetical protein